MIQAVKYLWLLALVFTENSQLKQQTELPFQTAKGHYFKLLVKDTTNVCRFLDHNHDFQRLIDQYPNIIPDRNLLVVKQSEKSYDGSALTSIVGFPLSFGTSDFRKITFSEDTFIKKYDPLRGNSNCIYTVEKTDAGVYDISGYFIEHNFRSNYLPKYAAEWVKTYRQLTKGCPIFLADFSNQYESFDFSDPISIFLSYMDNKADSYRPKHQFGDTAIFKKFDLFRLKSQSIRDSLFKHDTVFIRLLKEGIDYGLKNKISKSGFHTYAALISQEDALTLMRCDYPHQTCGNSSYYISRVIDIYREAKRLHKDTLALVCAANIFFDGGMNLHYDMKVLEEQKEVAKYLLSKGVSLGAAILGEILANKVSQTNHTFHSPFYWFDNDTINHQILDLLKLTNQSDPLDDLSKTALIENVYNLSRQDTTSIYGLMIRDAVQEIKKTLPDYVLKRWDHQATSFEELYYMEKNVLIENFNLQHVDFGYIAGSGYSWIADAASKVTMIPIEVRIFHDFYDRRPCWQFYADKVISIQSVILGNKLLAQEIESGKIQKFEVYFDNRSARFKPYLSGCGPSMPYDLFKRYQDKWDKSINISMQIKDKNQNLNMVLFDDHSFMIRQIHRNIHLGNYSYDDLMSYTEKSSFGPENHYSYRRINSDGVIAD